MFRRFLIILLLLALARSAVAQFPGTITLSANDTGTSCGVEDRFGLVSVYVVHAYTTGALGCRFSAPLPDCWIGATWLSDTNAFPYVNGNSQTGVSVAYGTCRSAPILVMTIFVFSIGSAQPCCPYFVFRDSSTSLYGAHVVTCAMDTVSTIGGGTLVNAVVNQCDCWPTIYPIVLKDPVPEDSASAVPLNAQLRWELFDPFEWIDNYEVYFGTAPNPPHVGWTEDKTFHPGPLTPNTTYYWRVLAWREAWVYQSPMWRFSTIQGVAAHQTTWGAIKSLYQ
jgi:hypothetical protein